MCRYDSTCDHLPLADLSPKEATHPHFEAFVISRKLNTDSITLSPPPPPLGGTVHHLPTLWPLCSVQKTEDPILFFTCI